MALNIFMKEETASSRLSYGSGDHEYYKAGDKVGSGKQKGLIERCFRIGCHLLDFKLIYYILINISFKCIFKMLLLGVLILNLYMAKRESSSGHQVNRFLI